MTKTLTLLYSRDKSAVRLVYKEKTFIMRVRVLILIAVVAVLILVPDYTLTEPNKRVKKDNFPNKCYLFILLSNLRCGMYSSMQEFLS